MNSISDYSSYNLEMNKSLKDKLFFIDKINVDSILDFGCANGIMAEGLSKYSNIESIFGYDIDPKMISLSKRKNINNVNFQQI